MAKRTRVIRVDPDAPQVAAIAIAGRAIRAGGLVAFPTETVYGLGANAFDAAAVAAIFAAKGRPAHDPLIVHIAHMDQLTQVARQIPPLAADLARRYWPGPLTLVLKKSERVPANLTAGLDTVAVRLPDHAVALALLQAAAVPIAAPSANQFSRPSPTSAQHVIDDLRERVDVVLDGGATPIGVESTILSLVDERPRVLRPGGIVVEALRASVPDLAYEPIFFAEDDNAAPAPGTMLRHYSPRARVILFSGEDDAEVYAAMRAEIARHEGVGLLACAADAAEFADLDIAVERLGANADEAARRLFAALRALDQQGMDCILARAPAKAGLGLAVWDRLLRAAVGSLVVV
ncbi:MAG: L-threonylcarbamoyladenylate synthase [Chloroflexota bacterium]|nr:L-threonylcarbamoyladenylate synthase [Chloroflexota bacterium]MDE2908801.1 L-threonylcarbamoyladenylate synthase [Chloroflexota bacterium]